MDRRSAEIIIWTMTMNIENPFERAKLRKEMMKDGGFQA